MLRNVLCNVALLAFSVTALTSHVTAGEALAPVTTESGLTVGHAQSSGFMNSLSQKNGPVEVTVSFELRDINNIDDEAETVEFTGVMRLSWHDLRQAFDPRIEGTEEKIYQGNFQFNEVFTGWFPQLILVNESGLYGKHGVLLRVRSDGSLSLFETIDAVAKIDLDLRRYPIDKQRLEAVFDVLGFDGNEIALRLESTFNDGNLNMEELFRMPQWYLTRVESSIGVRKAPLINNGASTSTFIVSIDLQRRITVTVNLIQSVSNKVNCHHNSLLTFRPVIDALFPAGALSSKGLSPDPSRSERSRLRKIPPIRI